MLLKEVYKLFLYFYSEKFRFYESISDFYEYNIFQYE